MSKKIIYLLSLLMALSLVFASCKKNDGVTGIQGDTNQEDEIKTETGGLQTSWDQIKNETIMNDYAVIGESGGDYYRNPVIVALGDGNVLIVTEKRINFKGSDNDIGVNGEKPVSIVYLLSSDAGDNFSSAQAIGGESTSANDAVSAPVVFYKRDINNNNNNKIYIIASAGSGISRANQLYNQRNVKSKLKYAVGTVSIDGSKKATINWNGGWKDLNLNNKIDPNNVQFGTHSGRGIIASDGKTLVLPIITADQGINGNPGINAAHEMMGVRFFKVTGADANALALGDQIGQTTEFTEGTTTKFSVFKEARAVDYNETKVTYLAVPSPSNGKTKMGLGDSEGANNVKEINLTGSEGSFGFLKFADNTWYGASEYNPSTYATTPENAGGVSGGTQGGNAILFSHVQSQAGANHLYMLNSSTYVPEGGSLQLAKTSKSSSIDVLPDGTVIVVAEKERNTAAEGLKFNIFFSRYTQKYLAEQLQ